MSIMKFRRGIGLASVLVCLLATTAFAQSSQVPSPKTPPPGSFFTTEEQETKRHEAFWKRINAEENRRKPATRPGEVSALYVNGDTRIDGPYFSSGSGAISDDSTSGIANNIWPLFLRVLSYTSWKAAGTIISNVNAIYNVTVDRAKTATAESYHSYSYYLKDGDYYKDGYWYTGARVEQRVTYASGWSMYYDTAGVPHSDWEPQGWQYLTDEAGCHWNDHAWILGHASNAYTLGTPMMTEGYNTCSIWNP